MRKQKVFPPGQYKAVFQFLATPRNGRVRMVFTVLDDESEDYENVATDKAFIDDSTFAKDFVKTHGTNPHGLKNRGFVVKLGHTYWGGPTILNWERKDFVLPEWFRKAQDKWQSKGGAKAEYITKRRARDPKFNTACAIREKTWESLILGTNHGDLLGCTPEELRKHIEKQFRDGMNWRNYATCWSVDHCRPLTSFDLTRPEEVRKAAHYSNLQPMEAEENKRKYNAMPEGAAPELN